MNRIKFTLFARRPLAWAAAFLVLAGLLAAPGQAACAACGETAGTWHAMAPSILEPRSDLTAFWTGKEVLYWGGLDDNGTFSNGALYNPRTDAWRPIAATPLSPRGWTMAVWTGSEMIVWGGTGGGYLGDGARYNPATNTWKMMSGDNAPSARSESAAAWTGTEMIIWGGAGKDPSDPSHTTLLAGGGRYNPATDTWALIPADLPNSPAPSVYPSAAWTGSELFLWGGSKGIGYSPDGALYDPAKNSFRPISKVNAPTPTSQAPTYWTGTSSATGGEVMLLNVEMSVPTAIGGFYGPASDTWRAIVPSCSHFGFGPYTWTGTELYAWSELDSPTGPYWGLRYTPALDQWSPLTTAGAPDGRVHASSVWTGREFVLWGGVRDFGLTPISTGGRLEIYPYQMALPVVSTMSGAPGLVSPDPLASEP